MRPRSWGRTRSVKCSAMASWKVTIEGIPGRNGNQEYTAGNQKTSSGFDEAPREKASTSRIRRLPSATAESVTVADVGDAHDLDVWPEHLLGGLAIEEQHEPVPPRLIEHRAELAAGEASEPPLVPPGRRVDSDRQRHWLTPRGEPKTAPVSSPGCPSAVLEHQPCERRDGAKLGETTLSYGPGGQHCWQQESLRGARRPTQRAPCRQARGDPAVIEASLEARALGKSAGERNLHGRRPEDRSAIVLQAAEDLEVDEAV